MNNNSSVYGNSKADSHFHQMKNSEWGAVAYLTQSKYGRNGEELTNNNNSNYITGIAADVKASTTANVYRNI